MRMIVLPLTLLCFLGFGIATAHSGPSGPYIVTVGDSIVQTYPVGNAIYGWGQTLPGLFNSQVQWTIGLSAASRRAATSPRACGVGCSRRGPIGPSSSSATTTRTITIRPIIRTRTRRFAPI